MTALSELLEIPSRFVNLDAARQQFGAQATRFVPYFMQGDPLADRLVSKLHELPPGVGAKLVKQALTAGIHSVPRAPEELIDFFSAVENIATRTDLPWATFNQGGAALFRTKELAILVLACYALPSIYMLPACNKPLTYTKKLVERTFKRLVQTAEYVLEICRPDSLRQNGPGYQRSIRVRLIHAQVRRLLLAEPSWKMADWGVPINQVDLLTTLLYFSVLLHDGIQKLGFCFSLDESNSIMQLWRHAGCLMGVDERIHPTSLTEGRAMIELIQMTSEPPDQDARTLVSALIELPLDQMLKDLSLNWSSKQIKHFIAAIARHLIGEQRAEMLNYEKTYWRHILPYFVQYVRFSSYLSRRFARLRTRAIRRGVQIWENVISHDSP